VEKAIDAYEIIMKSKILPIVFAFVTLLATNNASAYYNPQTGRWLSRDPLGEPGFELIRTANTVPRVGQVVSAASLPPGRWINRDPFHEAGFDSEAGIKSSASDEKNDSLDGPNLYSFVQNDSIRNIDSFGLLKFSGCSPSQQAVFQSAFDANCQKVKSDGFKCCLGHFNIPQRLGSMCNNNSDITIKCEPDTGKCKNNCGYSVVGGSTIHVCPRSLDSQATCGPPGCTLFHEMTHMIGHFFEKWPQNVEKCLGCQEYE